MSIGSASVGEYEVGGAGIYSSPSLLPGDISAQFVTTAQAYGLGLIPNAGSYGQLSFSGSAYGNADVCGTIGSSYYMDCVANGISSVIGGVNRTTTITATSIGRSTVFGSIADTLNLTCNVVGALNPSAIIVGNIQVSGTISGLVAPIGKSNRPINISYTASGYIGYSGVVVNTIPIKFSISSGFGPTGSVSAAIKTTGVIDTKHGISGTASSNQIISVSSEGSIYPGSYGDVNSTLRLNGLGYGWIDNEKIQHDQSIYVVDSGNTNIAVVI